MSKADTIAIFGSNQTTAEGVITANETLNKLATDPAEGIIGAGSMLVHHRKLLSTMAN